MDIDNLRLYVDDRPGEGVFSTLLVGSGIWRGLAEFWAKSEETKMTNRKIRTDRRFKAPPQKSLKNL